MIKVYHYAELFASNEKWGSYKSYLWINRRSVKFFLFKSFKCL